MSAYETLKYLTALLRKTARKSIPALNLQLNDKLNNPLQKIEIDFFCFKYNKNEHLKIIKGPKI